MNKAVLLGRLTKDPELRQTSGGHSVASFTLAVDRPYKNQRGERETDFIPCVAWRGTADFISKYFNKGVRMGVVGSIQPRSWEDEDGGKRYVTEVIVTEAYFADGKTSAPPVRHSDVTAKEFTPETSDSTTLPFDL